MYELTNVTWTNSMAHIISQHTAVIFSANSLYTFKACGVAHLPHSLTNKISVFYPVYLWVSGSDYFPSTLSGCPALQIHRTSCMQAINDVTLFKLNPEFKILTKSYKNRFYCHISTELSFDSSKIFS